MADDKKLDIVIRLKDSFSKNMKGVTGAITGFTKQLFSLKGLIIGGTAGALGKSIVDITSKFEQWQVAFETLTGSTEKANKLMGDLKDLAKATPFELPGLIDSTKRLLAMGIETEKVIETTRMLGDITAGVGTEKMPQLILAFGQVKTAGRLMGQELRQFNEAGVDLLGGIAANLGKTKAEVKEMVSEGLIGFSDVEQAMKDMTSEGGKFFNLMEKQSKTFGGTVSNIQDNLTMMSLAIGNQLLPHLKQLATAIKEWTGEESNVRAITNRTIDFINWFLSLESSIAKVKGFFTIMFKNVEKGFLTLIKSVIKFDVGLVESTEKAVNKVLKFFGKKKVSFKKNLDEEKKELKKYERDILKIESDIAREKKDMADAEVRFNQRKLQHIEADHDAHVQAFIEAQKQKTESVKTESDEQTEIVSKAAKKQAKKELEVYRQLGKDIMDDSETFGKDMIKWSEGLADVLIHGPDGLVTGMEKALNESFPKELSAFLASTTGSAIAGFAVDLVTAIFGNEPTKSVAEQAEDQFEKMVKNTNRALRDIGRERTLDEKRLDLIRELKEEGKTAVESDRIAALLGTTVGADLDTLLGTIEKRRVSQEEREFEAVLGKRETQSQIIDKLIDESVSTWAKGKPSRAFLEDLFEQGLGAKEMSEVIKEQFFGEKAKRSDAFRRMAENQMEPIIKAFERLEDIDFEIASEQLQETLDVFDIREDVQSILETGKDLSKAEEEKIENEKKVQAEREKLLNEKQKYLDKLEEIELDRTRAIQDLETDYTRDIADLKAKGLDPEDYASSLASLDLEKQRKLEDITTRFGRRAADLDIPELLSGNNSKISTMNGENGTSTVSINGGSGNSDPQATVVLELDGVKLAQGVVQSYNRAITQRRITTLKGT